MGRRVLKLILCFTLNWKGMINMPEYAIWDKQGNEVFTMNEKPQEYWKKQLKKARIALIYAQKKKGVTDTEINNIKAKIKFLEGITHENEG